MGTSVQHRGFSVSERFRRALDQDDGLASPPAQQRSFAAAVAGVFDVGEPEEDAERDRVGEDRFHALLFGAGFAAHHIDHFFGFAADRKNLPGFIAAKRAGAPKVRTLTTGISLGGSLTSSRQPTNPFGRRSLRLRHRNRRNSPVGRHLILRWR
jgi:hypothetical protein